MQRPAFDGTNTRVVKPVFKVGLVVAGYVLAFLAAWGVVALHVAATAADRQGSDGMYAFGDSLFFLAAFGIAAVPATGVALFFLKPYLWFWRALSVIALALAVTAFAAAVVYVATRTAPPGSSLDMWPAASVLRLLIAPLFALAFFLSGLFAPARPARIALLAATGIEATAFAVFAFLLIWSNIR